MDRFTQLLTGIDKEMSGIEIAPWFAPLVPRAAGYNVKILDVFNRETLVARAMADPNLTGRDLSVLEDVDYVGSATEILKLVPAHFHGSFDYIVSSHNFEHLANPIKFLQGCARILRSGGILSMAVPDRRACFDYFRPNTILGDWLDAYVADRNQPTIRQIFDHTTYHSELTVGDATLGAFSVGVPIADVSYNWDILKSYEKHYGSNPPDGYVDCHCTVMTPTSLDLLLVELQQLDIVRFEIEDVSEPWGCEFFMRLRFDGVRRVISNAQFNEKRNALLRRVLLEYAPQIDIPREKHAEPVLANSAPQPVLAPEDMTWKQSIRPVSRKVRSLGRKLRGRS